jgi:hypothetical protein
MVLRSYFARIASAGNLNYFAASVFWRGAVRS